MNVSKAPRRRAEHTVHIDGIFLVPAEGAFFYDDQAAIRAGAIADGAWYSGFPTTPGFDAPRVPAAAMSIGLVFGEGLVAWGDAMSVQYAAAGGRERIFKPIEAIPTMLDEVGPNLRGRDVRAFRTNCKWLDSFETRDSRRLPAALRYGISQAFLQAAAMARHCTMAEVIHQDFNLPAIARSVPVYAQSGDERYVNVDKMIMKRVDVLPHGLINSRAKFGHKGRNFLDYLTWVVNRIGFLGATNYSPSLHFDLYGTLGLEFGGSIDSIVAFLCDAEERSRGLPLCIESPIDFGSEKAQVDGYSHLRKRLKSVGSKVRIAVDEWCNTLDDIHAFVAAGAADMIQIKVPDLGGLDRSILAVDICKKSDVGAFLGGSCVETDISARASVHVAVATQADMQLAKPGMGVDEALCIVRNEQQRLIALLAKNGHFEKASW